MAITCLEGQELRSIETGRIIASRNRLIHTYASVADEVVWGVLETKLPVLRREVEGLLAEAHKAE